MAEARGAGGRWDVNAGQPVAQRARRALNEVRAQAQLRASCAAARTWPAAAAGRPRRAACACSERATCRRGLLEELLRAGRGRRPGTPHNGLQAALHNTSMQTMRILEARTISSRCAKNSAASCWREEANSGWPRPTSALKPPGRTAFSRGSSGSAASSPAKEEPQTHRLRSTATRGGLCARRGVCEALRLLERGRLDGRCLRPLSP
jgi:hypothetical protein